MCKCFETLRVQNFKVENLFFHQKRFEKTRHELYKTTNEIDLQKSVCVPDKKLYRVRVEYAKEIEKVSFSLYEDTRVFESFTLMQADFEYAYKFTQREKLDGFAKDILFFKDDLLLDTNIANIALLIDGRWLTPQKPMLEGTMRQKLLESGFLKAENLDKKSLKIAQKFAIMNALMGFRIIENVRIYD